NFLLFYFAWRYRAKRGRKALFYPHNNRLEVIWTAVPAVVLTLLVFDGVNVWHDIWEDPPADAIEIEVNGKQFGWTYRYPGADMQYGETSVGFMNDASGNELGFNFRDRNGHDDIVSSGAIDTIYFPVNKTVNLTIKSRDVLHSATLAHFRVKMDAVPGMPTRFTFKPILTTEEMRKQTGNPKFNYEMSCQQICGGGHWNMRRVIKVVEYDEYQSWLTKQTPFFTQWRGMTPANEAMGKEFAEAVEAANEEEPTVTLAE
ncbi:MAG: cytochrome c oxidase subunit II, partial [Bacteroidota bacterium]